MRPRCHEIRFAGSILPAMMHGLIGSASAIEALARTQENKITIPRPHCIQGGNPLFHEILKILLRPKKISKVAAQTPNFTTDATVALRKQAPDATRLANLTNGTTREPWIWRRMWNPTTLNHLRGCFF
jgi:hypothetical protein